MAPIRDLLDEMEQLYATGDADAIADRYADNAVITLPTGRYEGRQQIRDYWEQLIRGFPDGGGTFGRTTETEDTFFGEIALRATHTGDLVLPDGTIVPATGKTLETPAMELVRVLNGKVIEHNVYYDVLGQMGQLGLMPS